ncbi:MAG: hypothetical protein GYA55_10610 [SAR324 cluster bacterium]|uniref:Uncharacterized protein n=1 Tax=SAR324 cluster bacterium TaxID=2024889 RepID=A0A7X9FSM9_9DELT|nr:hypothetical protein [SAR324 cluster bacterium]
MERFYGIKDSSILESLVKMTCKVKTLEEVLGSFPKAKSPLKKPSKAKITKTKTRTKRSAKAKKPSTRKG